MGIEKYFQKTNTKKEKKVDADNADDDFQAPVKSKHFAKKSEETKSTDPKLFFASSSKTKPKEITKPKETTAPPKETKTVKEISSHLASGKRKKPVINISDNESEEGMQVQEKKPKVNKKAKVDVPETKKMEEEEKVEQKSKKKETVKPLPKKEKEEENPKKKTVTKRAKEDDDAFEYEEEEKAPKKDEVKEEKPKKKGYFNMMNREAPKALGTRPEPVGADNCLEGMTFVISGQYETLTKDQTKDIIMRYGGRVTSAVSGKTTYLLRGRDAGESKLEKAKKLKTKVLDEDDFYKLVETSSTKETKNPIVSEPPAKKTEKGKNPEASKEKMSGENVLLWTEKYKPKTIQEIVGNKEMVKRIADWLVNWNHNSFDSKINDSEINSCRAVIISGPPGIGKTTAAHVIARTSNYEPLELNASDVRNKKSLEQALSGMMFNRSMTEYFTGAKKEDTASQFKGKKIVLIMDEVDGMSAGDRGGAVELASQIKKSKIPVICICNDVRSAKVAPLLRVCFDARFRRTPANQIRSRIMTIAHKEKLDIKPNAVDELVASTQNDIRQIINILSTYRLANTSMAYDDAKTIGQVNNKNTILNLFEIPGELFSPNSWRQKNLNQLSEIYFHEYSLAPLMIQENYLKSKPQKSSTMVSSGNPREIACNEMDLIAKAADAIADGDLVDRMIHGTTQQYSLMPVHSVFSCVRPAYYMEGHFQSKTGFPSWLGQNSKANKNARLLGELHSRLRLKTSGDRSEIRQNYVSTLNERIFGHIKEERFEEAIEYMDNYYLDRESLETLNDVVCSSASNKGPMISVPTKTKTAFTRKYNSTKHPVLFQAFGEPIKKASLSQTTEDMVDTLVDEEPEENNEPEVEEEDSVNDSKFIKEMPKKESKKRKTTEEGSKPSKKKRS